MLENGLDGELNNELGCTKYDYRNKEGNNSCNGYSKKTPKTNFRTKTLNPSIAFYGWLISEKAF